VSLFGERQLVVEAADSDLDGFHAVGRR
jgi:hypothetical protein